MKKSYFFALIFQQKRVLKSGIFYGIIRYKEEMNMLKGVPKIISPELLKILSEMGHGDEIVIADGNFPSENYGNRVVRADGHGGAEILDAVLSMIPLDIYADCNFMLMQVVPGDRVKPTIWEDYKKIANEKDGHVKLGSLERFAFYERAKQAYAVIATGESAIYANIILKKGVIQ
jgi:rbsD or fucU transport